MRSLSLLFYLLGGLSLPGCLLGQADGNLSGTVTLKTNGDALSDATVSTLELRRDAHTDEEGRYELTEIPPGTYTVVAWNERLKPAKAKVTVAVGQTAKADFTLKRK